MPATPPAGAAVPPEAVTAAAIVLHDEACDEDASTCGRWNSKVPVAQGGYDPQHHIGYYEDRAREALEAAVPHLAATDRELLTQAENIMHSLALRLLGVSPRLKEPYTDAPECSPWSMTIGPLARRAHDAAMVIRRHLGLQHSGATRALGTPPLEVENVIAEAVAAERARGAHLLETARGVIANAGWDDYAKSPGWQEAAERWRDGYHRYLADLGIPAGAAEADRP